jgi:hypothetical protein
VDNIIWFFVSNRAIPSLCILAFKVLGWRPWIDAVISDNGSIGYDDVTVGIETGEVAKGLEQAVKDAAIKVVVDDPLSPMIRPSTLQKKGPCIKIGNGPMLRRWPLVFPFR